MAVVEPEKDRERQPWLFWVSLLALAGVAVILLVTRYGPGASGDSAYYVMGANNLLEGNGFSRTSGGGEVKPITGFPPGFSAALALLGLSGLDLFQVARTMNATLFGANILLVGILVHHYTRSIWPTILAALATLAAQDMVGFHAWVMSEPLYVFLTLLGILGIVGYVERGRLAVLVGVGLCLAVATLTRYVGLALVLSFALAILLLSRTRWLRRLFDCALLAGISLAPVYLWLRWNVAVAGTGVNREVIYHPMRPELIRAFLSAASSWFVPEALGLPLILRGAISLALALTIPAVFAVRSLRGGPSKSEESWRKKNILPWILLLYIGGYLAVLVVNSTFLDAGTTLSAPPRYLLPVYVATVIFFACVIFRLLEDVSAHRVVRFGVGLAGLAIVGMYLPGTIEIVRDPIPEIGYTGLRHTMPEVVSRLEEVAAVDPIISNNPEMVFILVGRPAYMRPIQFDAYQLAYREDFAKQVTDAQTKLDQGAVLVLFGALDSEEKDVLDALRVTMTYTSSQATFYVSAEAGGE